MFQIGNLIYDDTVPVIAGKNEVSSSMKISTVTEWITKNETDSKSYITPIGGDKGNLTAELIRKVQDVNDVSYDSNIKDIKIQTYNQVITYKDQMNKLIDSLNNRLKQKYYDKTNPVSNITDALKDMTFSDTELNIIRSFVSYMVIIEQTKEIIKIEKDTKIFETVSDSSNAKTNIMPEFNVAIKPPPIYKINTENDTYNSNNDKRYLYGIAYYFN